MVIQILMRMVVNSDSDADGDASGDVDGDIDVSIRDVYFIEFPN